MKKMIRKVKLFDKFKENQENLNTYSTGLMRKSNAFSDYGEIGKDIQEICTELEEEICFDR